MTMLFILFAIGFTLGLYALSANANVDRFADQDLRSLPVAASQHIYRGSLVGVNPAGHLKTFVPGDLFRGVAYEEIDNSSGSAAAKNCRYWTTGDYVYTLTSVAVKDVGKPVFATADNAIALTGHPDAFVGWVTGYHAANTAVVRLRAEGVKPPNGAGSIELVLHGQEAFAATGATAGTSYAGGFDFKSILGLGLLMNDAEDGGIKFSLDATAEIALASVRTRDDCLPVDKGITFEADLVVSDSGDHAALDIDFGLGTALTTNSEADVDHGDMAQLACFHLDGAADDILAQSDDATTDVAAVDTTINNDSATDVAKKFKIIVRPTGAVEFWIAGAQVLSTTTFGVLSTANLGAFVNMEKTSNDTTAELLLYRLRVAGGKAA